MDNPSAVLAAAREELSRFPAVLEGLVGGLDDAGWRLRPVAYEWSPVEILCHLRDEEAEDFGARVRVILDGGTAFVSIDPVAWATARRYREADGPAVLGDFRDRRAANIALLADAAAERLAGAVTHPSVGRLSGLDLVAAWVEHDRQHLAQLAATLARNWATRWAPLRADYAGPLPYARP
jgi:hypothetical protein